MRDTLGNYSVVEVSEVDESRRARADSRYERALGKVTLGVSCFDVLAGKGALREKKLCKCIIIH